MKLPQPADGSESVIEGRSLNLERVAALLTPGVRVRLAEEARKRIAESRAIVDRVKSDPAPHYGINTGFGALARERIAPEDGMKLQENLILSHAVGIGDEVPPEIVRLMLLLKIAGLSVGNSGVTPELVERLVVFFNEGVHPIIFTKGSLGASGDLAPLAHLTLAVIGLGEVDFRGRRMPAREAHATLGIEPLRLQSKEGISMINGTQFMSAYAVHCLLRIRRILKTADIAATLSIEGWRGSVAPFDERIHLARPHPGALESASNVRRLLEGSQILTSHADCDKVQDPYSLRCVPQVHGAARDAVRHAQQVVEVEINSATDNPLVFENGDVISGGNFHGEPLALALDYLAIGTAEIASISERRTYLLLGGDNTTSPPLPRLLMKDTGINSGFMIPQYTSAALVSENKILAHPASVDSIPSSLGQEDHVSMGAIAATKLRQVVQNTETVLAIELLCAAQAMDFMRPLCSGPMTEAAHAAIRARIPFADSDRLFHNDIQAALELVQSGAVVTAAEAAGGALV
ncbi:MAG TPA: histidine ammonia-lyase [Opitutaceae bacterium]|nr:histidine ammonia-lyase [Opitutaceae bacterium]